MNVFKVVDKDHRSAIVPDGVWKKQYVEGKKVVGRKGSMLLAFKSLTAARTWRACMMLSEGHSKKGLHIHEAEAKIVRRKARLVSMGWVGLRGFASHWRKWLDKGPLGPCLHKGPDGTLFCEEITLGEHIE